MRTREDIHWYLRRTGLEHREVNEGTWIVRIPDRDDDALVVREADTLVLFRLKVGALSAASDQARLTERLLTLNADDVVHAMYGVSDGDVVLACSLQMENLDYAEFAAVIDDFGLTLSRHTDVLDALRAQ